MMVPFIIFSIFFILFNNGVEGNNMSLVLLKDFPLGSMCIDGSPSGYYIREGTETNKWIIHHEGGGWCTSTQTCGPRTSTPLGSSVTWQDSLIDQGGILSDDPSQNPDFYNWTMVFMAYCDGSSFSSSVTEPIIYGNQTLYYRGKNNLDATIADLTKKGLLNATDVIITGCSAGGLSTYIHLDYWASHFPSTTKVRGIADAGWFLDIISFLGVSTYTPRMQGGWAVWNSTNGVNADCIAAYNASGETWKCIFANYTYPFIKTPIFVYNSKYDSYQIPAIFDLPCANNLTACNTTEYQQFLGYGSSFLSTVAPVAESKINSLFIDACYVHCQSLIIVEEDGTKLTAAKAFANWYFDSPDDGAIQECTYPCNPTCF